LGACYSLGPLNALPKPCSFAYSSPMGLDGTTRRVYMTFFLRNGWYCQFLEPDLKTPLPRTFTFATSDKIEELIRRGAGMRDLADQQAVEHGIGMGRGGVYLNLTEEQYGMLK
jgi:hypothetical protein